MILFAFNIIIQSNSMYDKIPFSRGTENSFAWSILVELC